jgi:hypothetical protein
MREHSWLPRFVLASSVALAGPLGAQAPVFPVGATPSASVSPAGAGPVEQTLAPWRGLELPRAASAAEWFAPAEPGNARGMPRWVRWGLVGAAAGAVTLPLLGSLASDGKARPARDAAAGAVGGFILVGGSVALWDAVCGENTRSRRAGLCGRR